jgi:hypothetical protein
MSGKPTTPTTLSRCCLQHFSAAHWDRVIRPQLSPRQPHCPELAADHIWQLWQLDVHRADVGLVPGVDGWLRFRAWSCTSASPIGWVSS